MKCQSKLLNQERATRLVVLQSPPLPPLLLDGNLLKAHTAYDGLPWDKRNGDNLMPEWKRSVTVEDELKGQVL